MTLDAAAQDRIFTSCSHAIAQAGPEKEALFLARLALLLFEQVADERVCEAAIAAASDRLPSPSLSADNRSTIRRPA